jgi:hypothetical protein
VSVSFPEIFGYRFRKRVAETIHHDLGNFIREDEGSPQSPHLRWNGNFDRFKVESPFPFDVWIRTYGDKFRLQSSSKVYEKRRELWSSPFSMEIQLKTEILTLSKVFPFELSRCVPQLVDDYELKKTSDLMRMIDLTEEFNEYFSSELVGSQDLKIQQQIGSLRQG